MVVVKRYSAGTPLLVLSLLIGCDPSPVGPPTPIFRAAEAPAGTNAVAVSESRIDVGWQDNSSTETGFEVHRSTAGASGAFALVASTGAGATTYSDVNLTPATQYCYKVRAFQTTGRNTGDSQFSGTACATTATPPQPGSIHVTTATTGAYPDPDGYFVRVDGGPDQLVGTNATITIANVSGGNHTVLLGGVASNCVVDGVNPRSISVNSGTTDVGFGVACGPGNTFQVTTLTTGVDRDQDGYGLAVFNVLYGGGAFQLVASVTVPANGIATIPARTPGSGDYRLELTPVFGGSPVAPNCDVTSPNPLRTGATAVEFDIACAPITQLAFSDTADGNADIYVINSNGTGRTRLTTHPARDVEPAWSPDGRKIAFTSDRDGHAEIYVMNADGTSPVRLTNEATGDYAPAWSRDGKIAFVSDRDGNSEIFVMNADGTNPVSLSNLPYGDRDPVWSPDGAKIVFTGGRDGADAGIYVMNADGSGVTRLASSAPGDAGPAWSPDGARIAFSRVVWNPEYGPTSVIFVMNADGSGVEQLTAAETHTDPAWYADGRKIAYVSTDPYSLSTTIHVMRLDGTEAWAGVPFTNGFNPAWRR